MNNKYIIGLTGLIGSGKSLVAQMFSDCGATIIDTDVIAHDLTAINGIALPTIESAFGDEYITPEGALDRNKMRQLVFANAEAKKLLESILHPLIYKKSVEELADKTGCIILVVPLLFKTNNFIRLVDRTLFVDCDEDKLIQRVQTRSNLSISTIKQILNTQVSREEQLKLADDVIKNNSTTEELRQKVIQLYSKYTKKRV